MANLTLRLVKGAPISNEEADNNFIALNTELGDKLNSSEFTAQKILNRLKTVDGLGSGLDADLLRGASVTNHAPGGFEIIGISRTDTIIKVTTKEDHNLVNGQDINIYGVLIGNDSSFNGVQSITTVPNRRTFTYGQELPDVPNTDLTGKNAYCFVNVTAQSLPTRDDKGNLNTPTLTAMKIYGDLVGDVKGDVTGNVSGTAGTVTGIIDISNGGTGSTTPASARTALGLGSMARQNANAVSITGGTIKTLTDDLAIADGGTGASNPASARTNLGIGSIATQNSNAVNITGGSLKGLINPLAIEDGGTGTTTLSGIKSTLGLGNAAYKDVGTSANQVSKGDHNHDAKYLGINALDTITSDLGNLTIEVGDLRTDFGDLEDSFNNLAIPDSSYSVEYREFKASGIFTVPTGFKYIIAELSGGGGGGMLVGWKTSGNQVGSTILTNARGLNGNLKRKIFTPSDFTATQYPVIIGSGGKSDGDLINTKAVYPTSGGASKFNGLVAEGGKSGLEHIALTDRGTLPTTTTRQTNGALGGFVNFTHPNNSRGAHFPVHAESGYLRLWIWY